MIYTPPPPPNDSHRGAGQVLCCTVILRDLQKNRDLQFSCGEKKGKKKRAFISCISMMKKKRPQTL